MAIRAAGPALAFNALGTRAAGLSGKPDREVRRYAIEQDRIPVTLDADFGNLIPFSPGGTPGMIWLRPRPPTEANIRALLAKWLPKLPHERFPSTWLIRGRMRLK